MSMLEVCAIVVGIMELIKVRREKIGLKVLGNYYGKSFRSSELPSADAGIFDFIDIGGEKRDTSVVGHCPEMGLFTVIIEGEVQVYCLGGVCCLDSSKGGDEG